MTLWRRRDRVHACVHVCRFGGTALRASDRAGEQSRAEHACYVRQTAPRHEPGMDEEAAFLLEGQEDEEEGDTWVVARKGA